MLDANPIRTIKVPTMKYSSPTRNLEKKKSANKVSTSKHNHQNQSKKES